MESGENMTEIVVSRKRIIKGIDGEDIEMGRWRLRDFIRLFFTGYEELEDNAFNRAIEYAKKGLLRAGHVNSGVIVHAVWDEVVEAIRYRYDYKVFPTGEFWQFPEETWARRLGDCEDTTYLLVSALRSLRKKMGLPFREIYACLGFYIDKSGNVFGHAFPIIDGEWIADETVLILESTLEKAFEPDKWIKADWERFFPVYIFNDATVYRVKDEYFIFGIPADLVRKRMHLIEIMEQYVEGGKLTPNKWMHKDIRVPDVKDLEVVEK